MRNRLFSYFIAAIVASCGFLYLALNIFVLSEFARIEKQEVQLNLSNAIAALTRENAALTVWARDYAPWDDTYEFIQSGDPEYITENFAADTIENLGFDLILFLDNSGSVVWSYVAGPKSAGDLDIASLPFLQLEGLEWDSSTGRGGLYRFADNEVYQIGAHPILTTAAKGPNRGSLVFGRKFDDRQFERIVASSVADFDLQIVGSRGVGFDRVERIQSQFGGVDVGRHKDRMWATTVLRDITDEPVVLLRVGTHRDTVLAGKLAIRNVLFVYMLIGLAILLFGRLLLAQQARAPAQEA